MFYVAQRALAQVFQCMKEARNTAIWAAYHNCVAAMEPQVPIGCSVWEKATACGRSVFRPSLCGPAFERVAPKGSSVDVPTDGGRTSTGAMGERP